MVNFPASKLDNLARQMLQITLVSVDRLPPMQNLLGNISGLYLIPVTKVDLAHFSTMMHMYIHIIPNDLYK